MQVLSFYFPTPGSRQLMCWAELNCLRYDPVWFVGEFLRVSCCGLRDILWAINQRLATQWEGIQHNFPVGLRRYEPSISTVGKAADLESLLLMWYVQLCVCECLSVCHLFLTGGQNIKRYYWIMCYRTTGKYHSANMYIH